MTTQNAPTLYSNLTPLDRVLHRKLRVDLEANTLERMVGVNSLFLAAIEFSDAAKEFPIVFVRAGEAAQAGGVPPVAPLAVMGLKQGSNLFVKDGKWTANYSPAYLRRYPFAMARVPGNDTELALCFDGEWKGFNETEGSALFEEDGAPTEFLLNAQKFLENFERETDRTRLLCEQLMQNELLQDMRFQATLPDGKTVDVDGFMAVNEEKLAALPDAKVVELFRNGVLAMIDIHRVSMGNMQRLAGLEGASVTTAA